MLILNPSIVEGTAYYIKIFCVTAWHLTRFTWSYNFLLMKGNYGIVTTLQTYFSILIQIKQSVLWLFVSLQSFAKFQTLSDLIHSWSFTQTHFVTPKNMLLWWYSFTWWQKKTPIKTVTCGSCLGWSGNCTWNCLNWGKTKYDLKWSTSNFKFYVIIIPTSNHMIIIIP